ncbi:MAG TPA: GFA family protein [Motiliproteus sp.]
MIATNRSAQTPDASSQPLAGRCLCGAVSYQIRPPLHQFHLCHCSRCQRSTGSAHAANIFADPDAIVWLSGAEACQRFDLPEARFFSRSFCRHCGSPVPYVARSGKFLVIPSGALEGPVPIAADDQIFWDDRANWYDQALLSPRFKTYPGK